MTSLCGLSQTSSSKETYPQIIQSRDGVVIAYTPRQNKELARLVEEYNLAIEVVLDYKSLVDDYRKLNDLNNQEVTKLDSLVIVVDKKFGLAQKEVWRLQESLEISEKNNKKLTEENKHLRKGRRTARITTLVAATFSGFLVYRSIR
jgi:hypothetical protein